MVKTFVNIKKKQNRKSNGKDCDRDRLKAIAIGI
jgi:hypothetical protein